MKTKAMVAGAVVFALLLLIALLLATPRRPPQDITLRHVNSTRTNNVTTMSFEVRNHTSDPYIFFPFEVQVRTGDSWTKFQGFDMTKFHPAPRLAPAGLASCTVGVTNLPARAVARLCIHPQKVLLGVHGFLRRAELEMERKSGSRAGRSAVSLNPYDRNSQVYGMPTKVVSEEFVEAGC
jgi:hypothetical protein